MTPGLSGEHYCRNCGVRLRRVLGRWWHTTRTLGPVPCGRPEPDDEETRRPGPV